MFSFNAFKSEYEKLLKKNSVFFKNKKGGTTGVVLFTITSIFTLAVFTYILFVKKLIPEDFFFGSIVVYLGWLFVFLTGLFNRKQNREDNSRIQNNEIRKRLEIEAFKEVNKAIEKTATILAEKESCYYHMYTQMNEAPLDNTKSINLLLSGLEVIYNKMGQQTVGLPELWKIFNLRIKAHEIVLTEFEESFNVLKAKFKGSISLTRKFKKLFLDFKKSDNLTKNDLFTLKEKCKTIKGSLSGLGLCLKNYRVEIMNKMLGSIFNRKIQK